MAGQNSSGASYGGAEVGALYKPERTPKKTERITKKQNAFLKNRREFSKNREWNLKKLSVNSQINRREFSKNRAWILKKPERIVKKAAIILKKKPRQVVKFGGASTSGL